MTAPVQPELRAGRAYRTRDLARWGRNPARLAQRLVREGKLREAAHGLYYAHIPSRFGPAPVPDEVLLQAFLDGEPFLISGPPRWNALGLGSAAMFATTLVYPSGSWSICSGTTRWQAWRSAAGMVGWGLEGLNRPTSARTGRRRGRCALAFCAERWLGRRRAHVG